MSRYQELQASLQKRITETDQYWADLHSIVNGICNSFTEMLELPAPTFQNELGRQEYFVKLGKKVGESFVQTDVKDLPRVGEALEFAVSLVVLSAPNQKNNFYIQMRLHREGGTYKLLMVASGKTILGGARDCDNFAETIIAAVMDRINPPK
jgi:hypothetical protein